MSISLDSTPEHRIGVSILNALGTAGVPGEVLAAAGRYWAGRVADLGRSLAVEDDVSAAADLRTDLEIAQDHHQALERLRST